MCATHCDLVTAKRTVSGSIGVTAQKSGVVSLARAGAADSVALLGRTREFLGKLQNIGDHCTWRHFLSFTGIGRRSQEVAIIWRGQTCTLQGTVRGLLTTGPFGLKFCGSRELC